MTTPANPKPSPAAAPLTDAELRVRIAEACGWRELGWYLETSDYKTQKLLGAHDAFPHGDKVHAANLSRVPDYPNSLDAMHEAEATLSDEQQRQYCDRLIDDCAGGEDREGWFTRWPVIHAPARARALAFCAVLEGQAQ